jgi:hypothetical protein
VQFFHKPAVLDLFQKRAIDEIARFQIFSIGARFGAMIENRLNARRGLPSDKELPKSTAGSNHQRRGKIDTAQVGNHSCCRSTSA